MVQNLNSLRIPLYFKIRLLVRVLPGPKGCYILMTMVKLFLLILPLDSSLLRWFSKLHLKVFKLLNFQFNFFT
ncbi:unnamed protein product [Paramecium pentaurelia]|uniref:Uncharacterized protein n=1 Tax=Paramecium pentaurelia TaxID=43138 RepID=A0A8S1XCE8_9CILI|nr:unnamed protein product [Paramecium pentaurelia]